MGGEEAHEQTRKWCNWEYLGMGGGRERRLLEVIRDIKRDLNGGHGRSVCRVLRRHFFNGFYAL